MKNTLIFLILLLPFYVVFAQNTTAPKEDIESSDRVVPKDYAENYAFMDPDDRRVFLKLTKELRCPKCQNQNIADSDAMIAHDMRRKVYELMQEGSNEAQVIDFMKVRYGDFVHYQPPVTGATIWLWLVPIVFVIAMMTLFIYRRKPQQDTSMEDKLAQADEILNKID